MENSQTKESLVSICIPVFNGEKTIRKTIVSILNQTYKNLEIIVMDNCSTDSTVKIVKEFRDPRIQLVLNDIHVPCGEYNWNRCFPYVHGEFMAIFHADDLYLPQMISQQVETFDKFPLVGCIFTQANIINEEDEIIGQLLTPDSVKKMYPHSYHELMPFVIENGDFLICPSAMIRTEIYKTIAPFRYEQFRSASDFDMWLRSAETAPIIILDEKLMNYRVSKTQGTYILSHLRTEEADFFKVLDFHISKKEVEIPRAATNKYELLRFEDNLIRAHNYLGKNDLKGFRSFMDTIEWRVFFRKVLRVSTFSQLKLLIRISIAGMGVIAEYLRVILQLTSGR